MRLLPLLCLCLLICSACVRHGNPARSGPASLPRPAPAYTHFLQKQAMLTEAPEIIAEVSQSERLWLQGSGQGRTDVFLKAAPNWLELDAVQAGRPVFSQATDLLQQASRAGITGLYLGQTGERTDIWLNKQASAGTGAPASLHFDSRFGTDEDFEHLAARAENLGMELGSSLLPGATGIGPDFLLQARRAPEFNGVYAMLPLKDESMALPAAREEWDFQPLKPQIAAALAGKGVIPENLARDTLAWASPSGWAVSGAVAGMDGVSRRWVYRYAGDVSHPVLAWPDPSGNAAKIFAAAIIRGTGLLGQSLVGLHFEPLFALEPGTSAAGLSPGLDAINELSRQAHRYGGWTLQADAVPADVIEAVLSGACDFCRDDVTPALVLFGFLHADGRPVAALYRQWIARKLDFARLARGVNCSQGLAPRILLDRWPVQAAELSSFGAEITAQMLASRLKDGKAQTEWENFQMAWRIGLPGLAFLPQSALEQNASLANALRIRRESGLALGRPINVVRGRGGGFGLLSALPEGGYWLLACNFGINKDSLEIVLPEAVSGAQNVSSGGEFPLDGQNFHIVLDGRAAMNVVFMK